MTAAAYLADLSLDSTTIAAALLHDVVEDTDVSVDELRVRFGDDGSVFSAKSVSLLTST